MVPNQPPSPPPGESFIEKYRSTVTSSQFLSSTPTERINAILAVQCPQDQRFYSQFMETEVTLVSFRQPTPKTCSATYKFTVSRFYCNGSGNLHGGAQSLIYDMLTSIALQAIGRPDFWMNGGVSRSLDVTYLRPAPEGIEVLCEVELMSAGKNMALSRGVMKREKDGALISTCEHDKAAVPNKPGFDPPKL